jgi:putative tricarboxylic transport membrane protein
MQAFALRAFVKITQIPMYTMASVILVYCAIGTFALNNNSFDMWTLFWFGMLGYLMKKFGFPLAPVILGVVLGDIAELNLNRAWTINPDVTLFFTQPWSLFFLLLAVFSTAFPWYQKYRGKKAWTMAFVPVMLLALSVPLFMMGVPVRIGIGAAMIVLALWLLWRAQQAGWRPDASKAAEHETHIEPA